MGVVRPIHDPSVATAAATANGAAPASDVTISFYAVPTTGVIVCATKSMSSVLGKLPGRCSW